MLTEHRRYRLPTIDGKMVEGEINFSQNKRIANAKVVRFHHPGGTFEIKSDDLVAFLFLIGDSDTIEKLSPTKHTKVKVVEELLTFEFTAKRGYAKGEKITVQAPRITTIKSDEEMMYGLAKQAAKNSRKFIT